MAYIDGKIKKGKFAMEYSIAVQGKRFELCDSDAFDNMAVKVLGKEKFDEMKQVFRKGRDKMVDESFRNHPLVRIAMWFARRSK